MEERASPSALLVVRGLVGGLLMGLANLVPGISGGTMLLASGIYPGFIGAIAELCTLRFRLRSILLLGAIAVTAGLVVLLLAGRVKDLLEDQRWVIYSLFIGLTLGGVPLLWRMARPASPGLALGAAVAFSVMLLMAFAGTSSRGGDDAGYGLIFVTGVAASSAMILPGVSGGTLLLLLGLYEPILGSIDQVKLGLLGDVAAGTGPDLALVLDALHVVIPLGIGVGVGVVGVSNLLRWLLVRFEKPTLGALLGLLLGALVGLWPFQEATPPQPGDVIKGREVTARNAASFEPEDWPLRRFDPSGAQLAGATGLVALGLLATLALGHLERGSAEDPPGRAGAR